MSFCPRCGRQLADGEVCTCQSQASQPQQNVQMNSESQMNNQGQFGGQPQMNNQGQYNGQPQMNNQGQYNGQPQMNNQGQYNGQPQMNNQGQFGGQPYMQQGMYNGQPQMQYNAAPKQTPPFIKEILDLVSGIFKKPADAVKKFVENASFAAPAIIIAVMAVLSALGVLLRMVGANISTRRSVNSMNSLSDLSNLLSGMSSGKTQAYSGGEMAAGFFGQLIEVIAVAALTAALIMVIINAFEKNKKVTYMQALAIASLSVLVTVPFTFVGTIVAMIPGAFFGYLRTWMVSFANAVGLIFTFIGIKAVEQDDNHMPLVYGLAALSAAVLSTILGLLF